MAIANTPSIRPWLVALMLWCWCLSARGVRARDLDCAAVAAAGTTSTVAVATGETLVAAGCRVPTAAFVTFAVGNDTTLIFNDWQQASDGALQIVPTAGATTLHNVRIVAQNGTRIARAATYALVIAGATTVDDVSIAVETGTVLEAHDAAASIVGARRVYRAALTATAATVNVTSERSGMSAAALSFQDLLDAEGCRIEARDSFVIADAPRWSSSAGGVVLDGATPGAARVSDVTIVATRSVLTSQRSIQCGAAAGITAFSTSWIDVQITDTTIRVAGSTVTATGIKVAVAGGVAFGAENAATTSRIVVRNVTIASAAPTVATAQAAFPVAIGLGGAGGNHRLNVSAMSISAEGTTASAMATTTAACAVGVASYTFGPGTNDVAIDGLRITTTNATVTAEGADGAVSAGILAGGGTTLAADLTRVVLTAQNTTSTARSTGRAAASAGIALVGAGTFMNVTANDITVLVKSSRASAYASAAAAAGGIVAGCQSCPQRSAFFYSRITVYIESAVVNAATSAAAATAGGIVTQSDVITIAVQDVGWRASAAKVDVTSQGPAAALGMASAGTQVTFVLRRAEIFALGSTASAVAVDQNPGRGFAALGVAVYGTTSGYSTIVDAHVTARSTQARADGFFAVAVLGFALDAGVGSGTLTVQATRIDVANVTASAAGMYVVVSVGAAASGDNSIVVEASDVAVRVTDTCFISAVSRGHSAIAAGLGRYTHRYRGSGVVNNLVLEVSNSTVTATCAGMLAASAALAMHTYSAVEPSATSPFEGNNITIVVVDSDVRATASKAAAASGIASTCDGVSSESVVTIADTTIVALRSTVSAEVNALTGVAVGIAADSGGIRNAVTLRDVVIYAEHVTVVAKASIIAVAVGVGLSSARRSELVAFDLDVVAVSASCTAIGQMSVAALGISVADSDVNSTVHVTNTRVTNVNSTLEVTDTTPTKSSAEGAAAISSCGTLLARSTTICTCGAQVRASGAAGVGYQCRGAFAPLGNVSLIALDTTVLSPTWRCATLGDVVLQSPLVRPPLVALRNCSLTCAVPGWANLSSSAAGEPLTLVGADVTVNGRTVTTGNATAAGFPDLIVGGPLAEVSRFGPIGTMSCDTVCPLPTERVLRVVRASQIARFSTATDTLRSSASRTQSTATTFSATSSMKRWPTATVTLSTIATHTAQQPPPSTPSPLGISTRTRTAGHHGISLTLSLLPQPAQEPPRIPAAVGVVVTSVPVAATGAAIASAAIAAVALPGVATQPARLAAVARLAKCAAGDDDDEMPSPLEVPLQVAPRSLPVVERAAIAVGATTLVMAALPTAIGLVMHWRRMHAPAPEASTDPMVALKLSLTTAFTAAPAAYFAPTVTEVALAALTSGQVTWWAAVQGLSAVGMLVVVLVLLRTAVLTSARLRSETSATGNCNNTRAAESAAIVAPLCSDTRDDGRWHVRYHFFADVLCSMAFAALCGVRTESLAACRVKAVLAEAVAVLFLAYVVLVRPMRERAEVLFAAAFAVLQAAMGGIMAASLFRPIPSAAATVQTLSYAGIGLLVLQPVVLIALSWLRRRAGADVGSHSPSAEPCAEEEMAPMLALPYALAAPSASDEMTNPLLATRASSL
jgi:hypothetical protein